MALPFEVLARAALACALLAGGAAALAQPTAGCPPAAPTPDSVRADAQRQSPRDRGLLWRLDKDGRTSWLYGTIHLGRVDNLVPGPRIRAALAASDVLALELDPADPDLPRALMASRDAVRAESVLTGLRPQLERAAERSCVPGAMLAAMPPLMQLMTVSLWDSRRDGLHPELGVDLLLWGMARGAGKAIVGLETPALQMASLTPDSVADEREILDRGLQDLEAGRSRPLVLRLVDVWANGDEATLADYARWCECVETDAERRFYQRINDDRNPALADKLAALHATSRFFAGVGALHMTGAQALPALLRARGFEVQRIRFEPLPRTP